MRVRDAEEGGEQPLTVSVNFWFAATGHLLRPTRPLVPSMQCELARQLEYFVSDCIRDKARHVPAFFTGMLAALEVASNGGGGGAAGGGGGGGGGASALDGPLAAMDAARPADVGVDEWRGAFEYAAWKLALHLGAERLLPFMRDLCHPSRFKRLRLAG